MRGQRKSIKWEYRFLRYMEYVNFKGVWKERSITYERYISAEDFAKYNSAFLQQLTKRKG